jgi:hypothetical protein
MRSANIVKYLSKALHNNQKRGIMHHIAEAALDQWFAFLEVQPSRLFPLGSAWGELLRDPPLHIATERVNADPAKTRRNYFCVFRN